MSHSEKGVAFTALNELVRDPVWFVRLRAIISLGQLSESRAIPDLLLGLTDSHRLVRFRAAEALVELDMPMVPIFQKVVATQDRYGLQAYLTALENAALREKLEEDLQSGAAAGDAEKAYLCNILRMGTLSVEDTAMVESAPAKSAFP
jgi:HEAT repeat protein